MTSTQRKEKNTHKNQDGFVPEMNLKMHTRAGNKMVYGSSLAIFIPRLMKNNRAFSEMNCAIKGDVLKELEKKEITNVDIKSINAVLTTKRISPEKRNAAFRMLFLCILL